MRQGRLFICIRVYNILYTICKEQQDDQTTAQSNKEEGKMKLSALNAGLFIHIVLGGDYENSKLSVWTRDL